MARFSELEELRRPIEQHLAAIKDEQTALSRELSETPADILDDDAVERKNDFLRRQGLIPQR